MQTVGETDYQTSLKGMYFMVNNLGILKENKIK